MCTHSHSKRSNGNYAHSSKISQHNLWLLQGVVYKKPTITKWPTELPLCLTSSLRQEKKWPQFSSNYLHETNFVEIWKTPGVISELWGITNEQKNQSRQYFLRKCELLPVAPLPWKDRSMGVRLALLPSIQQFLYDYSELCPQSTVFSELNYLEEHIVKFVSK